MLISCIDFEFMEPMTVKTRPFYIGFKCVLFFYADFFSGSSKKILNNIQGFHHYITAL